MEIEYSISLSIKATAKGRSLEAGGRVVDIRCNHRPVKHLPTGQIRIQIDIVDQDEVSIQQIAVRTNGAQLLGSSNLIRIIWLARASGKVYGE